MKKLAVIMATLGLLWAGTAWAANTVQMGNGFIYIKLDASSNFAWTTATFTTGRNSGIKVSTVFPEGLALTAIKFAASAAAGVLSLRTESTTGPVITQMTSVDGGTLKEYYDGKVLYKPNIVSSEQTTPTNAIIWLEFNNKPSQ